MLIFQGRGEVKVLELGEKAGPGLETYIVKPGKVTPREGSGILGFILGSALAVRK
jgi:hypothetical protein